MAKKNRISFQLDGFERMIQELSKVEKNAPRVVADIIEGYAEDICVETEEAMSTENLPAKGTYSTGTTIKSVLKNPKASFDGHKIVVGAGFDNSKDGVGTLLITGTPRMTPNRELERLFVRKGYAKELNKQIGESIADAIDEALNG